MISLKIDKWYRYFLASIIMLILLTITVKGARAQELGDIGKPADYELTIKTFSSPIYGFGSFINSLPTYFDWRDMGVVTPAKDQGGCGGCWAFAAVGTLESKILIEGMSEYDLSEQQLISCNESMSGCSGGGMESLKFWETKGPMEESCTGYCACDANCSELDGCSQLPYRVTGYYTVDTNDINEIKASLYIDGPTYFRFDVYSDFRHPYSTDDFWNTYNPGAVYEQSYGFKRRGHAVLIIGWDDSKNAWLCKNSWGEEDGPNGDGTFWIAYSGHAHDLGFGMANIELSRHIYADFNGDGYSDLAIGVYGESRVYGEEITFPYAGAVNVIYGSSSGLTSTGNQMWDQDSPGIEGDAEPYDYFGCSLVAGDFNGDSYSDLAIGVYGEDENAGAVNVIYGSSRGLTSTGNQMWSQDSPGIKGTAESHDYFGSTLAVGDFNSDGYSDLAIGVYSEDVGSILNAGAVNIIYGSSSGLTSTGNQILYQGIAGIPDTPENFDSFGQALTVGDFNSDGYSDLAIGVYSEDVGSIVNAGAVNVIYGSSRGLTSTGIQMWDQDSLGIVGVSEADDYFGNSLVAGDFNGDGYSDLAIGVYREDIGSIINAGAVNVIYGSSRGLTSTGNQMWHQGIAEIIGVAERDDNFGRALTVGDFNSDGYSDLAIGVYGEDVGSIVNAGAVNVIYGSSRGLTSTGDQMWHQDLAGIEGVAERYDNFGCALTVGDFNSDGYSDLAIGVYGEDVGSSDKTIVNAGAVNSIYGSFSGLTSIGDQILHQGIAGIIEQPEKYDHFGCAL